MLTTNNEGREHELGARLSEALSAVARVFDVDSLLKAEIDSSDIVRYYNVSDFGYRLFHSSIGAIHMALNFDGKFDKHGYSAQARLVEHWLRDASAKTVLELGSGKGYNSLLLSGTNPDVHFSGVDLTSRHVAKATVRSAKSSNVDFVVGDFQQLPFPDGSFDFAFVVESICHATDMRRVLSEIKRVLIPGSPFIVVDAFRRLSPEALTPDLQRAAKLAEVSMAVGQFWTLTEWLDLASQEGLLMKHIDDYSDAIMPSLLRLEHLAHGFFKYPILTWMLIHLLPKPMVYNAIAGLLMPLTVEGGAHSYNFVVLQRA